MDKILTPLYEPNRAAGGASAQTFGDAKEHGGHRGNGGRAREGNGHFSEEVAG